MNKNDNINVVSAVLHLREASSNLLEIQPKTSNVLLELADELIKMFDVKDDEVSEMLNMSREISESGETR